MPCLPGADGRPVVLHVVHGSGGGAMGFIHDLALADPDRCHLALVARGSSLRRQYGEALASLNRVRERHPTHAQALKLLGELHYRRKEWQPLAELLQTPGLVRRSTSSSSPTAKTFAEPAQTAFR